MRVIVIGTQRQRRELRAALEHSSPVIVGEFDSAAEARAAGVDADGVLAAPPDGEVVDDAVGVETLTPRELQVLELVAGGLSNRAIGDRLGISDQTVKFHVSSIHGKLGALNRTDAVRRAVRRGLLTL